MAFDNYKAKQLIKQIQEATFELNTMISQSPPLQQKTVTTNVNLSGPRATPEYALTPSTTQPQQPQYIESVEEAKQLFPQSLIELLNFEAIHDHIRIKPKKFLDKADFAEIARITKDNGGEYISMGSDSHFRIYTGGP